MTKKLLFLTILAILLLPFAFAANVTVKTINNQISPFDSAVFEVTLYNNNSANDSFTVSHQDIMWSMLLQPITDYTSGVEVPGQGEKVTTLYLKPRETVGFGTHDIEVWFTSKNSNEVTKQVVRAVVREDLIKYPFDVTIDSVIPTVMSPKKTNSVKVSIINNNKLNVGDFEVTLKSSLIDKKSTVTVGSNQEKVVDFSINFDPQITPRTDTLTIQVYYNNSLLKEFKQDYDISGYGNLKRTEDTVKFGLKQTTTYTYTNDGTAASAEDFEYPVTSFDRFFTTTTPDITLKKSGERYSYTATVELGPGKTATIKVVRSYNSLLFITLLVIIGIIVYTALKNPLVLRKSAKNVEIAEGGISKLRVILRIRNRSGKLLKDLEIIDKIPPICVLERRSEETLKPSKIYQYAEGTAIMWKLNHLDPGQEMLLDYEVKTKLKVVGDLQLKPFLVRYGKDGKSVSNVVDVYTP